MERQYIWYYFNKIKTTQDTLAQLITEYRRNLAHENQEREIEREHKWSKEIKVQNSQHREEISKLLHKFKTPSEDNEPKTVKLPSLSIPTFDGDPTKWKSYWQQFEAILICNTYWNRSPPKRPKMLLKELMRYLKHTQKLLQPWRIALIDPKSSTMHT